MNQYYTRWEGTTRAIGSIIGSGILFLPSLTYSKAVYDSLISWILAILICFPGLYFLSEIVDRVKDNSGIGGFISLGLGKKIGNSIPILMLGTVCLGMPSAALIAGEYVSNLFVGNSWVKLVAALFIIWFGVVSNLRQSNSSSKILSIITAALLILSISLILLTTKEASSTYNQIQFEYNAKEILSGLILAFWAFAGFENLTFMAKNFKNPQKDMFFACMVSIIVCGAIYFMLTLNYASISSNIEGSKKLSGLYDLAASIEPQNFSVILIVLFAYFAVQINFNTWIEGIANMVVQSAKSGFLPSYLDKTNKSGKPNVAILNIGIIFSLVVVFAYFMPKYFDSLLQTVSTNFLLMYLLAMLSYFIISKNKLKKSLSFVFVLGLIVLMVIDFKFLIYPFVIIMICFAVQSIRGHND